MEFPFSCLITLRRLWFHIYFWINTVLQKYFESHNLIFEEIKNQVWGIDVSYEVTYFGGMCFRKYPNTLRACTRIPSLFEAKSLKITLEKRKLNYIIIYLFIFKKDIFILKVLGKYVAMIKDLPVQHVPCFILILEN